jgi:hypothetical protein
MNIIPNASGLKNDTGADPRFAPFVWKDMGNDGLKDKTRGEHGVYVPSFGVPTKNRIMFMHGFILGNIQGLPPIDNSQAHIDNLHPDLGLIPLVKGKANGWHDEYCG